MTVFALDPFWNDFFTVGGFFVGVLGFGYTIQQVRKTTAAAVAAERAAEETLEELRTAFRRFIGGLAGRYLAEARTAVETGAWVLASTRSNDLADMMGQMPEQSTRSADFADRFRKYAQQFAARAKSASGRFALAKWHELLRETSRLLDELQSPFPKPTGGSDDPEKPAPPVDPQTAGEDASRGGELGAARIG